MLSHFVFNETREDGKRQDGKNQRDFVPCEDTHLHEVFVCSFQLLLHQLQRKKNAGFPCDPCLCQGMHQAVSQDSPELCARGTTTALKVEGSLNKCSILGSQGAQAKIQC